MNPDTFRAMGLMVAAMAAFALEDFFIKRASAELPVGQILLTFSIGGMVIFGAWVLRRGLPLVSRALLHPLVLVRSAGEVAATLCFVSALGLIPLSLASAIHQATPLFATVGAAFWLREDVGWRRWCAVSVGLVGVLLILRPGLAGFEPAAVLAALAAAFLAIRDIASRRIPDHIANAQLAFWAFSALVPATAILLALGPPAQPVTWPLARDLAGIVVIGVVGAFLLILATRIGDVSAVLPFRYSRLVFALFLGVIFLGERPDLLTLVGAAIVVGSGLYTWMRERKRRRALSRQAHAA